MAIANDYHSKTAVAENLGWRENWRTDVVFAIS